MEKGFHSPSQGRYWQTTGEPSERHKTHWPDDAVEIPLKPGDNYEWDGAAWVFVPPPEPPIEDVRADAIRRMNDWIEGFTEGVTGSVPHTEKVSWPAKAEAARAIVGTSATAKQKAIIQAEADVTGEALIDLAGVIVAQADLWEIVASKITGLRRVTRDAINTAPDTATVEAILTSAQTQAATMAAEMGL